MKKLLLAIATLVICGAVSVLAAYTTSNSSNNPKTQQRKEARAQKQQMVTEQLKAALASQSFTFSPTSYTLPYQSPVMLYSQSGTYYLSFYPESLDIMLPFELHQGEKFNFDSSLTPYSDYLVKSTKTADYYTVTATLNNVSNMGFDSNLSNADFNVDIHLSVSAVSGTAFLTLTPDFSPAVTYQGSIMTH